MFGISRPRVNRGDRAVVRRYTSRGRIGELFKMQDGQAYVRTPYGFVKIDGAAAASLSIRFAVLRTMLTLSIVAGGLAWFFLIVR